MKKIDDDMIREVELQAKASPRRRTNLNFHPGPSDTLQRMLNAVEPDSYVQPHKHENPDKREAFLILAGSLLVVEFHEDGSIADHVILSQRTGRFGVEIAERTWHTIVALEPGTVAYELKDGPWDPSDDKCFAPWAPSEDSGRGIDFNRKLLGELGVVA